MDADSFAAQLAMAINKGESIVVNPKTLQSIIRNVFLVAHKSESLQVELISRYQELPLIEYKRHY